MSKTKSKTSSSLDQIFAGIRADKLPSLPHVLLVLLDASHTEVISFDRLSGLIKKDAALAARVISAADAAYYGGQGKTLTFERTLVMLGLDTIKTIAITASVQQFFSRFDSASSVRLKRFWRNSLTCALMAKAVAKLTGYEFEDEAYLAGLMHNIGELIFANNFPKETASITELCQTSQEILCAEEEHFGGNRHQAGAWLISGWNVDPFMADAILYQNESLDAIGDAHHLVKIIYLANLLCGFHSEPDNSAMIAAEKLFDLNHSLVQDLIARVEEEVTKAAHSMDIKIDESDEENEGFAVDQTKQVELADRVRNVALMDGVRQQMSKATSEASVLTAIKQGLNILFGVKKSFFFLINPELQSFVGIPSDESDQLVSQIKIPLSSSSSILSICYTEKRAISSFESTGEGLPSVVDRQLANLAVTEGVYCLPLIVDKHGVGVLVIGYNESERPIFDKQARLLAMFANESANHLLAQQQSTQAEQRRSEEEREYYHARAREIVHEVNNPLSIINNYVHILSSKLDDKHSVQEDLVIIKEELERAGGILLRLPGITDKLTTESGIELVNINNMLSDLLKVFRSSLFAARKIESHSELDEQMQTVAVDRNALKQVVSNIIKNAAEAMEESGRIAISTQSLVNQNGKNYVGIVIDDNGPGIPVEIQSQLFTPVTSTKGDGHSGLGLAIVKNLLDEMGGSISCRSTPETGTSFEILIPRVLGDED